MKHLASALVIALSAGCTAQTDPDVDAGEQAQVDGGADETNDSDGGPTPDDGGGASDMSSPNDAGDAPDGGPEPDLPAPDLGPGLVATFVAQGHMGRTAVSCDDGNSWVHDTSLDPAVRCFTNDFDCDHHPGAGRGVEWGDGVFLTTFGWGPPGGVDRSTDGVTWTRVLSDTTFGGIVYGNGIWLAAARNAQWSSDAGETWNMVDDTAMTGWNVRRAAFVAADGGRFVMVADDETVVSADAVNWNVPSLLPDTCGDGIQTNGGIAYGNQAIVVVGGAGNACASTDAGDTWSASDIGGSVSAHLLWDGSNFVTWGRGMMYSSPDGSTWTATPTVPDNLLLGPTAYNPDTGTYVGVRGGWQTWYEEQEFYRSSDGINWETLPDMAFEGSHPVRDISIGWVLEDDACQ